MSDKPMRRHSSLVIIISALCGIVVGTLVTQMVEGVPGLSWLAYSMAFGTSSPLAVDLKVISFTVGATLNVSVATIIAVVLGIILGRLITKK